MDTMFMNFEKSEISDPYRQRKLKRSDKYVALWNLSICYTWESIKKPYKNSKLKISAPLSNGKFELPSVSYFVSDISKFSQIIWNNEITWKH